MDREYAERYRDLYQRHWWWRAREDVLLATLRELRPPTGWSSILDVGCGDGLFFDQLGLFTTFFEGVEADPALVRAGSPWRHRIHVGPFESFEPERRYGLVLMLDVLEHLATPAPALRHALSLLEPGGRILITVPAFPNLWTSHDDFNQHVTRFTRRSFDRLAAAASMRIDTSRYFFYWTCLGKLVQRMKERVTSTPPGPAGVPPAWLNASLLALCRVEYKVFGRLPLPFGTSLLVIGGAGSQCEELKPLAPPK
jgi:SAM-dependent methyltransferase